MTPNFLLQITFSWVEISLHVKFHPPGLPRSGRFIQPLTLFKDEVKNLEEEIIELKSNVRSKQIELDNMTNKEQYLLKHF